jgi:hypothetical protein
VRIKGTCSNCARDLLIEQVVGAGGRCPWCGFVFQAQYTAVLAQALQQADAAGDALEAALRHLADLKPAFELDDDSILDPLREAIRSQQRQHARV